MDCVNCKREIQTSVSQEGLCYSCWILSATSKPGDDILCPKCFGIKRQGIFLAEPCDLCHETGRFKRFPLNLEPYLKKHHPKLPKVFVADKCPF